MREPDVVVSREEQVRIEGELAKQLEESSAEEREQLYGSVYDRIYEMHLSRNPDQLEFGASPILADLIETFTRPGDRLLEVGCGMGLIAIELARRGRRVTGVEVSEVSLEVARRRAEGVEGVAFEQVAGMGLPFADASFDFVYSIEVLEHLHPDDVAAHLAEVDRILKRGGKRNGYWVFTPNGTHSISSAKERFGVDVEVEGDVHLKEWTYRELVDAGRVAGFTRFATPLRPKPRMPLLPTRLFAALEGRSRLRDTGPGRRLLDSCSIVLSR